MWSLSFAGTDLGGDPGEQKAIHTALGNTSQPGVTLIFCVRGSTKEDAAADHKHWLPSLKDMSLLSVKWNMGVFLFSLYNIQNQQGLQGMDMGTSVRTKEQLSDG